MSGTVSEYPEWYVPGYGTEKVAPFLRSLVELTRPQRILEIGMGYTTPFLLEGLSNNTESLIWDSNCDKEYLTKEYLPKFVVVDDQSLDPEQAPGRRSDLEKNPLVSFIEGNMFYVVDEVRKDGPYDLVWFDCGGPEEYEFFVKNYWDMVKEYALFHFTYFKGEPNRNNDVLSTIDDYTYRMDIVEPHKFKQGSITMFRKS
jgi:predicted O-methyltransferase YrrM|tara:strand:+ start:395 stop:997 length:603 start_codon:yes stop_codon:yes gene_type:complete